MARWKWFLIDVAALLAVWAAVSMLPAARTVLPPISDVAAEVISMMRSGELSAHIAASLLRTLQGFMLAVATGIPLGILIGSTPWLHRISEPCIEVLRPISPIAWIPLSILWFGIGEASKIFIIWLITFFFVLLNTIAGVIGADNRLLEAARTLGASRFFVWRKVILPAALPQITVGMRLGLSVSIGGVLIAEMIAANRGLGFMMERARVVLDPEPVIIGMIVIGLIGYAANRVFVAIERALMRYRAPTIFAGGDA